LTLAQLLTVPIFSAVALACIIPAIRSGAVGEYGIVPFTIGEAILVPLLLATTAQLILRRGRGRERLVAVFLSASAMSATVAFLLLGAASVWDVYAAVAIGKGLPVDLFAFVIAMFGGVIATSVATRELWSRAFPGRCPRCGRRALFLARGDSGGTGRSTIASFVCELCGLEVRLDGEGEVNVVEGPLERSRIRLSVSGLIGLR
jgi:hypothetical protein